MGVSPQETDTRHFVPMCAVRPFRWSMGGCPWAMIVCGMGSLYGERPHHHHPPFSSAPFTATSVESPSHSPLLPSMLQLSRSPPSLPSHLSPLSSPFSFSWASSSSSSFFPLHFLLSFWTNHGLQEDVCVCVYTSIGVGGGQLEFHYPFLRANTH